MLLDVRNLRVTFPVRAGGILRPKFKTLVAVNDVSFQIKQGEALGVVGESGCGKSSLGRAILRLIEPTAGSVLWLGKDLVMLPEDEMNAVRQDLQIVFQDPLSSHNPTMSVGEIIGEPLTVFHPELSKTQREEKVGEIMREVHLRKDFVNRYPHELSGGECQRVSIARAMILSPKLIVFDEPMSALDVSTQAAIIRLIKLLLEKTNVSILFISHDLSVVWHLCQRLLVMYLGKLVEVADRESLFRQPRHPYTKALISAILIPDPALEKQRKRVQVQGEVPSPMNMPSGCVFRTRCPHASSLCATAVPKLEDVGSGRSVACHHWRDHVEEVPVT